MNRVATVSMLAMLACAPGNLGVCDAEAMAIAYRIVEPESGDTKLYAGQALLYRSCGGGTLCHAAAAEGADRFGVPSGLDFDMQLVRGADYRAHEQLRASVQRVRDWNTVIMSEVDEGSMPPGEAGELAVRGVAFHMMDDASVLPPLESDAGRMILRQWLACGAPVIEREDRRPIGFAPVGDIAIP